MAALDRLIEDREPESLFLDFKRSFRDGDGARLADDDNKNISKAISGFANSSGGLLVWGVDCRRDPTSGTEVAEKRPLTDAVGFRTKIEAAISRATLPAHPGVQAISIVEAPGSSRGFVAMLIPPSPHGPLRSVVTHHYHLRVGSDFGIVPHDVLAGMFGRQPRPKMSANFLDRTVRLDDSGRLFLSTRIIAVNLGAVFCERPYLSILHGSFPESNIYVTSVIQGDYVTRRGSLPIISLTGVGEIAIPPGASGEVCDLAIAVPQDYAAPIDVKCTIGCSGAEPATFLLQATEDSLAAAFTNLRAGSPPRCLDVLLPTFPSDDA